MREIKFRAWGPNSNYMWSWEDLVANDTSMHWMQPSFGEKVLMQFTGLRDKHGKDIYEGDLLRFPAKDSYENKNFSAFEVFFHDNDCADRHIGFQMCRMHNYGAIAGGFCGHLFLPKTTKKMEIIGNIYENTELIK